MNSLSPNTRWQWVGILLNVQNSFFDPLRILSKCGVGEEEIEFLVVPLWGGGGGGGMSDNLGGKYH